MAAKKLNTNTSIVDYLKSIGKDSSYSARAKLAQQYGISGYTGTASQNISLLNTLKSGKTATTASTAKVNVATPTVTTEDPAVSAALQLAATKKSTNSAVSNAANAALGAAAAGIQTALPKTVQAPQAAQQAYQSPYSAQIESLLGQILNKQSFSYDASADPLYKSLSQQYQKNGNLAMRDTMGNAAALTGGYGSSYATTAGSQAYDSYMQDLNNQIPQLYQLAYDRYNNELSNQYNSLSALQGLENTAYGRYNDQRNYDYQVGRDTVADSQWLQNYNRNAYENDRGYNYQVGRDEVSDAQWLDNYNRNIYESDRDYNTQAERYKVEDSQWNKTFNQNVSESNRNYSASRADQAQSQKNWQASFDYQKTNDAADRAASAAKAQATASKTDDAATAKEVSTYSKAAKDMLKEKVFGISKYSPKQVYDFIIHSNISDEAAAQIIDSIPELRAAYK